MDDNLKKRIEQKQGSAGFIKTTDFQTVPLSDQQKVALNRRANALFNEGKFDMAERIYVTTGYSDGLSRTGDRYLEKKDYLNAIRMYTLAHNQRKSAPIIEKIASVVSVMLKDE
ncbi:MULTISPECIES: hypothetical protein [Treponema]|jgi:hypothetical protein|uniref:Tetratricopeptide repeat-containing protein n=1 Tax=Treponema rectale TaxID=744512 RepID=A0A840S736_9SPIR|nr:MULTISPECIES: hypothetical protein [Treponema]MBB5218379.1 hypothetical protein [Treponema rectale]MBE6353878.1 hypothetical protein [Treponema sp.]QOS39926.1 hypothetical protein DYE49_05440 [Treponema rectale]